MLAYGSRLNPYVPNPGLTPWATYMPPLAGLVRVLRNGALASANRSKFPLLAKSARSEAPGADDYHHTVIPSEA